jgi:hypothetical protein
MKAIALAIIMVALVASPVSAKQPHKIGLENVQCLNSSGIYGVLVTGDIRDGSFDYANNPRFRGALTTALEGYSGAMAFNAWTPTWENAGNPVIYAKGVWFRWTDYPKNVTYLPVPHPCRSVR